jgi:ABC-type multidrug transport system fused ATPase/permease subunit
MGYSREYGTKGKTLSATFRRNHMSLISLVGVLIVVGVLLWLINTYVPMDGKIKSILNAVVVIAVVLWLLQVFGIIGSIGSLNNIRVGK